MISNFYDPRIGGVEKHIEEISKRLTNKNFKIIILTEKHSPELKSEEKKGGIRIFRIKYPKIKFFGLSIIWINLLKNLGEIRKSNIVHIHDVFVWYFPFRFLFPNKKIFITHHGGQAKYPIPKKEIFFKRLASRLSSGTICVGGFIPIHFGLKCNSVIYGATKLKKTSKKEKRIVWVGRLEEETGIKKALKEMKKMKNYRIDFCGDGPLRNECEKAGTVHGFTDPLPFLKKAKICYPVGYLSCLEAMANKCEVRVVWENKLKKDYWQMTPFYKYIKNKDVEGAYEWVKTQTWDNVVEEYLKLWGVEQ